MTSKKVGATKDGGNKGVLTTYRVGGPSGAELNILDAIKFSERLMSFISLPIINHEGFLFLDRPELSFSRRETIETLKGKQFYCNFVFLSGAAEKEFIEVPEIKAHFFNLATQMEKCIQASISRFDEHKEHCVTSFYDEDVDELSVGFYRV